MSEETEQHMWAPFKLPFTLSQDDPGQSPEILDAKGNAVVLMYALRIGGEESTEEKRQERRAFAERMVDLMHLDAVLGDNLQHILDVAMDALKDDDSRLGAEGHQMGVVLRDYLTRFQAEERTLPKSWDHAATSKPTPQWLEEMRSAVGLDLITYLEIALQALKYRHVDELDLSDEELVRLEDALNCYMETSRPQKYQVPTEAQKLTKALSDAREGHYWFGSGRGSKQPMLVNLIRYKEGQTWGADNWSAPEEGLYVVNGLHLPVSLREFLVSHFKHINACGHEFHFERVVGPSFAPED